MNPPKYADIDYINFLVGTQKSYSCLEAEKVQPQTDDSPAHDSITRLLHRDEPDTGKLWHESKSQVKLKSGILVIDDSTLDKPYSQKIDLVTKHWSGKHHRVVHGINLITLLWTNGDRHIPCDYRIYNKAKDGLTKNDHFRAMLTEAKNRGFVPECLCFDSWYASLENLKAVRDYGWRWLTRLAANRRVSKDYSGNRPVSTVPIESTGTIVHLKGYGLILVFKVDTPEGDIEYWATNDLHMNELTRLKYTEWSWAIEEYHRGIKQFVGVERAQVRSTRTQSNHIGLALRAFLRIEHYCYHTGTSWFEAKLSIVRKAVRDYLVQPLYTLESTA
jgi:hypothetical protein